MDTHKNRLTQFHSAMKAQGLSAYIIPSNDEFMNEYVPEYARRLEWLTGFSGSAGIAIILKNKAALFTDGRYTLQAKKQLPKGLYEIINTADVTPKEWLQKNLKQGEVGFNPMLFSGKFVSDYENSFKLLACDDLVDSVWLDQPQKPASNIQFHPVKYSGQKHADKIKEVIAEIKKQNGDAVLISAPDSICWLLNIRAADVPNTPLVLARLYLEDNGAGVLFAEIPPLSQRERELVRHLGKKIKIQPLSSIDKYLKKISGKKILIDKNAAPYLFVSTLEKKNTLIETNDPCTLPKACKNKVEVKGAVDAHVQDGAALTSFLYWLQENYKSAKVTELSATEKLLEFRQKNKQFIEPSFDTISGFGSNGAIVHYNVSKESSKAIRGNGLYLVDSGGQYLFGTTDVTRTVAIGKPTKEQKQNFTLVLKGHITLATAEFPEGASGHQLDILARKYLWQHGLDYDHGTGHGVGSFLGVHEGPQRISKAPNEVALRPGMIISNEPGYYKNGKYGIRIENLVVVEERSKNEGKKYLGFKTLTCAPIDPNLIDFSLLDKGEKKWLFDYHMHINKVLAPHLDKKTMGWIKKTILIYKGA